MTTHPTEYYPNRSIVKWYLICFSDKVFGNENILPFFFAVSLIPLVYLVSLQLTNSPITGAIAITVLLTTNAFTKWDSSATYDQTWSFFLLLSVYLLYKVPFSTPFTMILSIFSKGLTLAYVPMFLFHIHKNTQPTQTKKILYFVLGGLLASLVIANIILIDSDGIVPMLGNNITTDENGFISGLGSWILYFYDDLLFAALPAILVILFSQRKKIPQASTIIAWILGIIINFAIIEGFTTQINHPYRFVPLVCFYAIGFGMVMNYYLEKYTIKFRKTHPNFT